MSASELEFIAGLAILCGISALVYGVTSYLFYKTLSEEDAKALELDEPPQTHRLQTHTVLLALVNFISRCSFFLNSAILVAIGIKELL